MAPPAADDSSVDGSPEAAGGLDQRLLVLAGTLLFVGGAAAVLGVGGVTDPGAASPGASSGSVPGESTATENQTPADAQAASPEPDEPERTPTPTETPTPTPTSTPTETDDGIIIIGD